MKSDYEVSSIEGGMFGEKKAFGFLGNSFHMSLNGDSEFNGRFLMGSRIYLTIEWLIGDMRDLRHE